jgi:hypothetical protein
MLWKIFKLCKDTEYVDKVFFLWMITWWLKHVANVLSLIKRTYLCYMWCLFVILVVRVLRTLLRYLIWYDIYIFHRSWVDTRWQQYITHLHTNSTHNTEIGKLGSAGRAPSCELYPGICLTAEEKHGKTGLPNSVAVLYETATLF